MMKFQLGRLVITPAALAGASVEEICYALDRHVCGIWGDVSERIRNTNETAIASSGPLHSVYRLVDGTELQVLTTGDRLATTVHLPRDVPTDTERTPERTPKELKRITSDSAE